MKFRNLGLIKSNEPEDRHRIFIEAFIYATRFRRDYCCGEKMQYIDQFGYFENKEFIASGYYDKCQICGSEKKIYY
jgi:hypothetical protein